MPLVETDHVLKQLLLFSPCSAAWIGGGHSFHLSEVFCLNLLLKDCSRDGRFRNRKYRMIHVHQPYSGKTSSTGHIEVLHFFFFSSGKTEAQNHDQLHHRDRLSKLQYVWSHIGKSIYFLVQINCKKKKM